MALATPHTAEKGISFTDRLDRYRGLIALLLVLVVGTIYSPRDAHGGNIFLSAQTHSGLLFDYSDYGLLATGMTLVILLGGIDLSVSSVLGASAVLFSMLLVGYGWGAVPAILLTALFGCVAGAVNGTLIARYRLQPFVATLALMAAGRGLAKIISEGSKVVPAAKPWYAVQDQSPAIYSWMTTTLPGIGIQPAALLFVIALVVMSVLVHKTQFGRHIFAIGGNEESARLSGVPVTRVKVMTYSLCSLLAAFAGMSNACKLDLGDPEAGVGYELDAIAAVVIGGTSLSGGKGSMLYTFLGVLIMGYINKILSLNAVEPGRRLVIQAAIIVVAVLIQRKRGATA